MGNRYSEACHWILPEPMPDIVKNMALAATTPAELDVPIVFSALPADAAREAEPLYAQKGVAVCSNASAFRQEADVPLLLPEVNPGHTQLVHQQKKNRNWPGFIVVNSNCTITGLTIVLKPLLDAFGIRKVMAVSMQAVSGAGYPGVASLDILGNVIPYISDEERRMEWEPRKILGQWQSERVELADFTMSAQANRVPVIEGHMVCMSIQLGRKTGIGEVEQAMSEYLAPEICRSLPSSPPSVIQVRMEDNRPQPRLDLMAGNGMTTVVGRLRQDSILDYKMVILSHNTIRGAAGGSIYNAELLVRQGLI
ncbi:MAG TPA: aspartate-semialdehyde dehydrogenase, partial [Anaerolineales bacterium]|nr:aspartate-semialdehyde dehydrogenase [Anaerolineales bacterium]